MSSPYAFDFLSKQSGVGIHIVANEQVADNGYKVPFLPNAGRTPQLFQPRFNAGTSGISTGTPPSQYPRPPVGINAEYRCTDKTTVSGNFTHSRDIKPSWGMVQGRVENKDGIMPNKDVQARAEVAFTNGTVFHKRADVQVLKSNPSGVKTGGFIGVSNTNGKNELHVGTKVTWEG